MDVEEKQLPEQYVYVEPMGHGAHFVARLEGESSIPGASQFSVIRADGSIDRTLWMSGSSIFRATALSPEKALLLAGELGQRQSIYNADPPQRLLLEAAQPAPSAPGDGFAPIRPALGRNADRGKRGDSQKPLMGRTVVSPLLGRRKRRGMPKGNNIVSPAP